MKKKFMVLRFVLFCFLGCLAMNMVCNAANTPTDYVSDDESENPFRAVATAEYDEYHTKTVRPATQSKPSVPEGKIEYAVWMETYGASKDDVTIEMVSGELAEEETLELTEMYISVDRASVYSNMQVDSDEEAEAVYGFANKVYGIPVDDTWFEVHSEGEEVSYIKLEQLLTEEDFLDEFQYILAQALYSEAGGVDIEEMCLVGEVIFNRVRTTYWEFKYSNSIYEVLSQSGQYPTTWSKIRNGLVPSEDAMEAARIMLLGERENRLPEDTLWQTGFYPPWDVEVVLVTDCHWYAKLPS